MWAALRQEEITRLTKAGSNGKGARVKKEEDAALTSSGQQGQQKRKKKGISKVRCFKCGELGHYATQCPWKKDKEEASKLKVTSAKADGEGEDDDRAMSAHAPLEKRWGDMEL